MKKMLERLDEFMIKESMSDQAGGTFKTIESMLGHLGLDKKRDRERELKTLYANANVECKETREMKAYVADCIENKKQFVLYFENTPKGYYGRIYIPIKKTK